MGRFRTTITSQSKKGYFWLLDNVEGVASVLDIAYIMVEPGTADSLYKRMVEAGLEVVVK